MSEKSKDKKPNPGSDEAREQRCCCPVLDNGHGRGCGRADDKGNPLFWINGNRPIHGTKETK